MNNDNKLAGATVAEMETVGGPEVVSSKMETTTAVAPGIDLEQFRKPVEFWISHSKDMVPDMRTTATHEGPRLLALIDAIRGEEHCATCQCAPGMTPAIRFDLSPAAVEGEIRSHLVALGWTPPGIDLHTAYFQGWVAASGWAGRDDLLADADSKAYVDERDQRLHGLTKATFPCGAVDAEKCPGLCAELQASPKGGSCVVTDAMVNAALRVQYARAGSVWAGTEVNPDFVDMRNVLTAAMQATSAGVGA